jgi:hypothetical protein
VDDKWANEVTEVRSLLFIHVVKAGHKECVTDVLVHASYLVIPFKNSLHVIASGPFYYRHGAARRRKCLAHGVRRTTASQYAGRTLNHKKADWPGNNHLRPNAHVSVAEDFVQNAE